MQTEAEKYLIKKVVEVLEEKATNLAEFKMINIGAAKSLVIEKIIQSKSSKKFICDRVDVNDCRVDFPLVGDCFMASVEDMKPIKSENYDLAFANYVFEHINNLDKAAKEVARILKASGSFIVSLPNPQAPEFILSKHTSTKFHQIIKGEGEGQQAYETHYVYKDVPDFVNTFKKYFKEAEVKYWSNTYSYLFKFPIINFISKIYDATVNGLNLKFLMGNVCVVFKK
jgi:SAM-dependent methyltransferase